ncbi:glycoside hydrolase family 1 protein [Acetivibrio cellulolyticus]|uniref:glycoside hydrolase family 1 protein n=1 Tax=Acetivibrio cellulolyticus TaxID=35830 RepID=UPI0001E2D421|nr:glycoside hydrolase family 1 protein [Acetivibrio cellulolyticus]
MESFVLPEDFLLGTATASLQIEGGDKNNTWYKWCEEGHIKDGSSCITACDHWNRVEQDTELLIQMNVNTHRMSLEWSRIEPKAGEFSSEAIEHYRNEINLLIKNGIKPLITLHHFSEPLWFYEMGGWLKTGNSNYFLEYVKYVIEHLGDEVCEWITFNEPNVYTKFGYIFGLWPPGHRKLSMSSKVCSEIIKAHVKAYQIIHSIRKEMGFNGKTRVGFAMHIRIFCGVTFMGRLLSKAADYFFHELYMEGMIKSNIKFPLSVNGHKHTAATYADFIGINYYTRNIIEFSFSPSNLFHSIRNDNELDKNDLGWDIYPEGIYSVCKKYYERYRLPIYITENGISDKSDSKRPNFICSHLANIAKAIGEGTEIQRYYHWTLMDNFEWLDGQEANFGLYHCNFETQERTIRPGGNLYSMICKEKKLTDEMMDEFLKAK